jgi:hypothetical protein
MVAKKRASAKKQKKKSIRKRGPSKHGHAPKSKKNETKRVSLETTVAQRPSTLFEQRAREQPRVTLENIHGDTLIGDLLVAFPWTRDVLAKKGLRLEAEEAGDIYMSLEAFSAMNGLTVQTLVEDVTIVAREPPQQPASPLVAAPAT